jgi:hydrogenase nickel incorporation protein HypA/HybF
MHEIRIAEELSAIVLEVAHKERLKKVTTVNVCFGQMVQVVPQIFESAFREMVRGTKAHDSKLDIEIIPVRMRCRGCGLDFKLIDNRFSCCNCGSDDLEWINGKELFIKSIEGD